LATGHGGAGGFFRRGQDSSRFQFPMAAGLFPAARLERGKRKETTAAGWGWFWPNSGWVRQTNLFRRPGRGFLAPPGGKDIVGRASFGRKISQSLGQLAFGFRKNRANPSFAWGRPTTEPAKND